MDQILKLLLDRSLASEVIDINPAYFDVSGPLFLQLHSESPTLFILKIHD
jgi:hypothetical protein